MINLQGNPMIKWEDLSWQQKAAFWIVIGVVGWFSPEIALLFHFGGIEVVFAFLAFYLIPILRQIQTYYFKFRQALTLAIVTYQSSAAAKPRVYFTQAVFCSVAFMLTGSVVLSAAFLMPGMLVNGFLT
ncbi:hypothetical protein HHX48_11790 [Salinimonas sp. HHU 13199]|uniref:Uncharacterized protein n=1 Tax=Salinimonas profundi TaxID=2729140 RepID=A0ABR8LPV4_9ALTE|nr:hypothetical protein [Salinimonas profundi]MBD3586422.1 hypothetical protein [Salinimonas profundi]